MRRKNQSNLQISGSFRDPSGFLFRQDGQLYRQINSFYKANYDFLMNSGLYNVLVDDGLLIEHKEVRLRPKEPKTAYKIIQPKLIPFLSYPYEWSFSQLKEAALLTLKIQKTALKFGMSLKDASAFNVQFLDGRPIFIDTLSFEKYIEGRPWVGYRQFCQHFLAPLALISYKDVRLNQLLRIYIDGLPLDLVSALLPLKSWLNFSLLSHIHLHAKSQKHYEKKPVLTSRYTISKDILMAILDSLESAVLKMKWKMDKTEWGDYYEQTNYSKTAFLDKQKIVKKFLDKIKPKTVWDLGANTGIFSRIAAERGALTISFDADPLAVEKNYLNCVKNKETRLLPLVLDLTNPSPGLGWANEERMSLKERGPTDTVLALALLHHLAISNNLPFNKIAEFLRSICRSLIIEFVPKSDSNAQKLLRSREDIFFNYDQKTFEIAFGQFFPYYESAKIKDSKRVLYLFQADER